MGLRVELRNLANHAASIHPSGDKKAKKSSRSEISTRISVSGYNLEGKRYTYIAFI